VPPVGAIQHTDVRRDSLTLEWEPPKDLDRLKSYIIERYDDEEEEEIQPTWRHLATIPTSLPRYELWCTLRYKPILRSQIYIVIGKVKLGVHVGNLCEYSWSAATRNHIC
jgi:hypothetical protein